MKKIFFMMIILISIPCKAFTYETNVHMQITKRAISLSTIEQYLSKNLNISLSDKFSNGINRRPASEWLELGSNWEDNAPRWLNHFYDPTTGKGLNPCPTLLCTPSIQWGKYNSANAWSWKWARDSYYKALTDAKPSYREIYFSYVFRSLGQIIHLVQDLAVPAHVRNDAHPYPYLEGEI